MSENIEWFKNARFGMFIHWGAYSVAARGEWVLNRERIPYDEYTRKYVDNFKAENYNPREWVKLAKKIGMKYVILTTRHHDGFALWDTDTTDFNSVKMGPKKDIVRQFADAVREEGLKLGFYYSFADSHNSDYPAAYARDWAEGWKDEESRLRFVEYYHTQIKELMTRYGKVDILWYDGCAPGPTDGKTINEYVKSIQPHIIISNRNGHPYDFVVCEQEIRPAGADKVWEACMTLNNSWGYTAGDRDYKSAKQVISMLGTVAAGAGNLLLNVGPMQDGTIPEESIDILNEVGKWMESNGDAIYNSSLCPFTWLNIGRLTTKDNKVYLHIYYSAGDEICLAEIKNRVLNAKLLETGETVEFQQESERLFIKLNPKWIEEKLVPVIELEVDGKPEPITKQTNFWIMND